MTDMKQIVLTCDNCGKQERVESLAGTDWFLVRYSVGFLYPNEVERHLCSSDCLQAWAVKGEFSTESERNGGSAHPC